MEKLYWIWLSTCKFVGPVLQKRLINHFQSPRAVYEANESDLYTVQGMNKKSVSSILKNRSLINAKEIARKVEKNNIQLLLYSDDLFPQAAKKCREMPIILYYIGKLKKQKKSVAVVGARRCSPYGKKVAYCIGEDLARAGIPIVSGFARGIDSYVHEACIKNDGHAIVFLAGGVNNCYPIEQLSLYQKIIENDGIFLSQYPPGTPPTPKRFIQRNALISAWADEVVIVEASQNSGALLTAKFAINYGKNVYAVPNQIDREEGHGSNLLLSKGARPYLHIDSLNLFNNNRRSTSHTKANTKVLSTSRNGANNHILKFITETPSTISTISKLTNIHESTLMDQLIDLELQGEVIIRGNLITKA